MTSADGSLKAAASVAPGDVAGAAAGEGVAGASVAVTWEAGAGGGAAGGAGVLAVAGAGVEGVWEDALVEGFDDAGLGCIRMISKMDVK